MGEYNKWKIVYDTTKGHRIEFIVLFACVILNALTTLLFPHIIGQIVEAIFYIQDRGLFFKLFFLYFGIYLGNQLINCGLNYCYAHLKATYLVNIRKKCFEKIQRTKANFFSEINSGDVIRRINTDVDKFLDFIHFNIFFSISDATHLMGAIIYIFFASKILGGICVFIIPLMYYVTRYFTKVLLERNKKIESDKGILAAWIFEMMYGLSEIKLLNANHKINRDYMSHSSRIVNEEMEVSYKNIMVQRANILILLLGQLIFYIISAYCIINDTMSVGQFVACCTYYASCSVYYKNFNNRI